MPFSLHQSWGKEKKLVLKMYTSLHNIGKKIQKGNIKIYIITYFKYTNLNTHSTLYTVKIKICKCLLCNMRTLCISHSQNSKSDLCYISIEKLFSIISVMKWHHASSRISKDLSVLPLPDLCTWTEEEYSSNPGMNHLILTWWVWDRIWLVQFSVAVSEN